ncbi:DEAH (Asp-Glu-Ala-His) box polypeptide 34 [Rhizoclosmatium sp. JEL0117]|nr:DEAH (Asp-Glu-Ala-His) box polypeptide 34 [Rhizoclosmatium sp. JEL0117]
MAYGLGNPREFDFIERPDADVLESCMRRLQELGAVEEIIDEANLTTERERLTSLGKVLAILPMDVVLGKMLVLGSISDVVDAVIVMAAALTVPNPFVKVPDNRVDITERRNSLQSELGDPFTLLNLFSDWLKVKADGRESSKNWCKRYGVEEQRIYEMVKLKTQFEEVLAQYLGREQEDEIDSDEEEGKHNRRRGKKRIATSNRDGDEEMDEIERLKRRMFWKDPEFIKRKEQRLMLEQQKREQASGKRKFLKFEDGDGENDDNDDGEEMENPKNIDDLSVHHLEFTLSHDPSKLLAKSDAANLSKRDANLVRLVICSGLWPHIAVADEANLYRPASEQVLSSNWIFKQALKSQKKVFHTKTKRFVKMLPTSIFSYKPEILHPKELATAPPAEGEKETLDTIRPKQEMTELLCYLELLETNKPYLTNVLRIPAAPALDINQDMTHVIVDSWLHLHFKNPKTSERILVLGNWLRTAWDHILGRRLKHVNHGLAKKNDEGHNSGEDGEIEEEIELMGTAVSTLPTETKLSASADSKNMAKKRIPSDWTDLAFLPLSIKRVRYDWEMGTTRCDEGTLAGEEFESLTEYDLSRRLGEFCEIDFNCSVEKLRTQDIPNWFGFDPFKTDTSSEPSTNSNRFVGEILVTPYVHYFVSPAVLSKLSIKKKSKLQCSGPRVVLVERSWQETEQVAFEPPSFVTSDIVKDVPSEEAVDTAEEQGGIMMGCEPVGKKPYFCSKCGEQMQLSTIEILRHKKSCI